MNTNKKDIIDSFKRIDKCINDNTKRINDIICLIEFYSSDKIAVFEKYHSIFHPLYSCYLDNRDIIHISKESINCTIRMPTPERRYIELYNSSSKKGLKIRKVYFKDHVDEYKIKNSKLNIIKKFRHDNICIDDSTNDRIKILGLIEFNDPDKELNILSDFGLQYLSTCYVDINNNLHKSKPISKYSTIDYMDRESINNYNSTTPDKFKIKKIYFQDYTDVYEI